MHRFSIISRLLQSCAGLTLTCTLALGAATAALGGEDLGDQGLGGEDLVESKDTKRLTIVTLGDSITKGFRQGVTKQQTFSALLQSGLQADGIEAQVINRGIGGERTDQCLRRLDQIIQLKPDLVTIMYGTNDSYTDPGKTSSRISVKAYRQNLTRILNLLSDQDIQPILMTPPRFAGGATDGQNRDSNISLHIFVVACREVAETLNAPLVDHYADWSKAEQNGVDLNHWTTDRCHPNPAGHQAITKAILPVIRNAIANELSDR